MKLYLSFLVPGAEVIVLSVKVAKQRKPRPAQLRKAVITLTWGTASPPIFLFRGINYLC